MGISERNMVACEVYDLANSPDLRLARHGDFIKYGKCRAFVLGSNPEEGGLGELVVIKRGNHRNFIGNSLYFNQNSGMVVRSDEIMEFHHFSDPDLYRECDLMFQEVDR